MRQLSVIGLSNAGKTCYLYAMAKTMIDGYNGINAIALDDDQRDKLFMGWRKIRREAKWPEGNDKVSTCEFTCSLHLHPLMDFLWNDFKGGSLASMNEVDKNFRSEFNNYLKHSDGLIIFVPADTLQDILEDTDEAEDLLEDLTILTRYFIANMQILSQVPITIAITKSDLLDVSQFDSIYTLISNVIFRPLFQKGNQVRVLVTPVTIGKQLGRGKQGGAIQGSVYANPEKGNIHIPILFNLYHFLKECIEEEKEALGIISDRKSKDASRLSTARSHSGLIRWWKNEDLDTLNKNYEQARQAMETKKKNINDLEEKLKTVVGLFSDNCLYYINGSKVQI